MLRRDRQTSRSSAHEFCRRRRPAVQVIAPSLKFEIPIVDIRELPEARADGPSSKRLVTSECQRSFDLTRSPLLRATLVVLGRADHVLVMMMHHIIGDVWSVRVVMKELAALYEAFSAGSIVTVA